MTLVEWWLDEREDVRGTLRMLESGLRLPEHREGNAQGLGTRSG